MPKKGLFIVLEGPDKAGKSTQAGLLARALRKSGREVVHTREPGGTPLAEAVRRILLRPGTKVSSITELLLYEAARAQHVAEKIAPALKAGKVVLCERFTLATLVYQGVGRGIAPSLILAVDRVATGGLKPDLTIVLDIPKTRFTARMAGKTYDRIESEGAAFQSRIRDGYRKLAPRLRGVRLVDADRPKDVVHAAVMALVGAKLA